MLGKRYRKLTVLTLNLFCKPKISQIKIVLRFWCMTQVVEGLSRKWKALGSNLSTAKK
jgi:hypothetical protein